MTFEEFVAARLGSLVRYATVVTWDPHLAEDLAIEQIADILGCRAVTVRTHLSRALANLHQALPAPLGTPVEKS